MARIHPIYRARHGLDDWAVGLLGHARRTVLGTENADGSVHLTPVMFLFDAGQVYLETSSATRKVRNIEARPRATVLVLDDRADATAWVSGAGPAEIVRGERAHQLGRRIRARYLTERGEERLGSVMARYDDVAIVVTPRSWLAWDMTAFDATMAAHGLALDEGGDWFLPDAG